MGLGDKQKPKGKIKAFTESCYSPNNANYVLNFKRTYIYSDQNNLLQEIDYSSFDSNNIEHTIMYYYKDNNVVEKKSAGNTISMNGKLGNSGYKVQYSYDQFGNEVEEKYLSDFESRVDKFFYNGNKNIIKKTEINSKGNLNTYNYTYDNMGNLIEENWNVPSENYKPKYTYEYDNNKNKIAEYFYRNGNYGYRKSFKYDIKNNLTSEVCYYPDGRTAWAKTYKMEYDKLGNWISIKSYTNNNLDALTKREIIYFDTKLSNQSAIKIKLSSTMLEFLYKSIQYDSSNFKYDIIDTKFYQSNDEYNCEFLVRMKSTTIDTTGAMKAIISNNFLSVNRIF
jgi:hypothetical protein